MKILVEFGGFSLEESDQIRSAIAKKKRAVMSAAFDRIRAATALRGWTPEQAQGVCDILTAYSNYSFNRSHSAAYAQLGYITMWLKHHYPLEWWSSELNLSGEDKLRKYMGVIGHLIDPPSLKKPSIEWEIVENKIAAPLISIKGIGAKPVIELAESGPFECFEELLNTTSSKAFHLGIFSACLKARALDCFMDKDIPYLEARKDIVNTFFKLRGKDPRLAATLKLKKVIKTKAKRAKAFSPVFEETDAFKLFMMEREVSKIFAKSLLDDPLVCDYLKSRLPAMKPTGRAGIPYTLGSESPTLLVKSVANMEAILIKKPDINQYFYAVMLFQSSAASKGISKKSGRPWKRVEVELSDGVRLMYATIWDKDKAFGWQTDSPVLVYGKLQTDWRGRPSMNIRDITRLEDIPQRRAT
jgi:DNA polymerase III alpha subunit